jgi:hypothetical protein
MPFWIPSREDIALIKQAASTETGLAAGRLILEPGARFNIDDENVERNINIALVTKCADDSWDDTDLDSPYDLTEFKRGVTLTDNGAAIVDFYVSNKDGLHGNVTVYYSDNKIQKIAGYRANGRLLYQAR